MAITSKLIVAGAVVSAAGLGVVGGSMLNSLGASAATDTAVTATPAVTSTPTASPAPATGTFKSNEDATHEAGESAAREAQENAGQMPTVQ